MADDGIPATLPEWGEQREFPYEYTFSVMHAAGTATLAGGADFPRLVSALVRVSLGQQSIGELTRAAGAR